MALHFPMTPWDLAYLAIIRDEDEEPLTEDEVRQIALAYELDQHETEQLVLISQDAIGG